MKNNQLPTAELQKYGIINSDLTFNQKLTREDIDKFLQGYTIVADHNERRATFQLIDDQKSLKVILLERDQNIKDIINKSINEIQYSEIKEITIQSETLDYEKKVFVYDPITKEVVEYDLLKNLGELTRIIREKNQLDETSRYKTELLKLKSFLQDKMDQFPELSKEISNDLNIVSKEISIVDGISFSQTDSQKSDQTKIRLNVNDLDIYQHANQLREENNLAQGDEKFWKRSKK